MIFPIGDDQVKGGTFPVFSYAFIAMNVAVFVYEIQLMSSGGFDQFLFEYGAIPYEITRGQDIPTLFTSMFLHGGWGHIIGNMLFLWVFADNIEAVVGNARFLIFYILGGLAAHAAHIYFNFDSEIPTVGASGAISAVLGAYIIMFPSSRIRVLILFFVVKVPAIIFLGFWIFQQLNAGFASLSQLGEAAGVAWWAHIGGFAFGLLAGIFFRANGLTEKALRKQYV
ncbi:MAG: rhomboid family intramembrane serine protease [Bacteroidota bacterium]